MEDDGFDFGDEGVPIIDDGHMDATDVAAAGTGGGEALPMAHGSAAADDEISVEDLRFGSILSKATFLSNAEAAALCEGLASDPSKLQPSQRQAIEYANRFKGAAATAGYETLDELRESLTHLEYAREASEGQEAHTLSLHTYELAALSNLAPGTVDEAMALIPSLARFAPEEVEQMLTAVVMAVAKSGTE